MPLVEFFNTKYKINIYCRNLYPSPWDVKIKNKIILNCS